jgi:hypothetical protein
MASIIGYTIPDAAAVVHWFLNLNYTALFSIDMPVYIIKMLFIISSTYILGIGVINRIKNFLQPLHSKFLSRVFRPKGGQHFQDAGHKKNGTRYGRRPKNFPYCNRKWSNYSYILT